MGKQSVRGTLGSLSLPGHKSFFIPKSHSLNGEALFPHPISGLPSTNLESPTVNLTFCQSETHRHTNTSLGSYLLALLLPKAVCVLGLERELFCKVLTEQGGRDKRSPWLNGLPV